MYGYGLMEKSLPELKTRSEYISFRNLSEFIAGYFAALAISLVSFLGLNWKFLIDNNKNWEQTSYRFIVVFKLCSTVCKSVKNLFVLALSRISFKRLFIYVFNIFKHVTMNQQK